MVLHALAGPPESAVQPSAQPFSGRPPPLSIQLWDLDWSTLLPWSFEGFHVESVPYADLLPVFREHYARTFVVESGRFFEEGLTDAKQRFGALADAFVYKVDGQTAGFVIANPADWSTYYFRIGAILPEYRERRMSSPLLAALEEPLRRAGVERIETDCSPLNAPMLRTFSGLGYVATGTVCSERWGALLRLTRFLREEPRSVFERQFAAMSFDHVAPRGDSPGRRGP